ncbi:Nn.00g072020.m01.CDS01 [Neocucurbitaria sp. VM-36]
MISSPLPYNVKWTVRLIRRDVKDLKSKYAAKLKNKFTKAAKESVPICPQDEFDTIIVEPDNPKHNAELSTPETASTRFPTSEFTDLRSNTAITVPTEYTEDPEVEGQTGFTTLYELLETKLKELYASRDRDMSEEERWKFRGSWLLLHMAIQACPSNDSYNIFRENASALDESKMLLELLHLGTVNASRVPRDKVSQMPTEPYTKHGTDHARYDSAFSTVSFGTSQPQRTTKPSIVPSHSQIWHAIFEASTNHSKVTSVAEDILAYVWPEKNAADILDHIGHPGKQFCEDAELRQKFREVLFPGYDMLAGGC